MKKILPLFLVIFCLTFIVYANTLKNDFVWDDEYLILNNTQIKSFSHIKDVFKTYVGYGSGNINNFYRPLQELSNMIDYFLWGRDPMGFHLTNVLLHSLCAAVLFLFIFHITESIPASFLCGVLFGIHPINTEAVSYIAGRADPLFLFFFLLSLLFYVRYVKQVLSAKATSMSILSLLFFVCSILSKELAAILPLLIFSYLYVIIKNTVDNKKFNILKNSWIPYAIIVAFYGYLRLTVLDFSKVAPSTIFAKVPLVYRLITFCKTIMIYFGLLLIPHDLHMERVIPVSRSAFEPFSFISLLAIVAILFSALKLIKRKKIISFFILWFFIGLLPVSNIVPINSLLAEHWLYLPAIGIFALFGLGIYRTFTMKSDKIPGFVLKAFCIFISFGLITTYSFVTIRRNMDWKDEIVFFKNTLRYSPSNSRLHLNFGNTYYEHDMLKEAVEEYKKAIELKPDYAEAYSNIGSIYLRQGKLNDAKIQLEKAIGLKPDFPEALYMLAVIYEEHGDMGKAKSLYERVIRVMPHYWKAQLKLGLLYIREGEKDKALVHLEKALSINPNNKTIQKLINKYQ